MKKILLFSILVTITMSCKESKNESGEETGQTEAMGNYESVFIDVQNTEIPANIDPDVLMEKRLLPNVNLTSGDQFWGEKNDFSLFAMGSIKIPKSGNYYFKLTSAGKIVFKLDNKDLVKNDKIHDKETNPGETYLDEGYVIFEYEYYPAYKDPYLVLEWSTDGENFEIVPDANYNNLDAFTIPNWTPETPESNMGESADNTLSKAEANEGWQLLFDGKTTNGWHTYNKPGTIGRKWTVKDGALVFEGRKRFEFYVAGRKVELGPTNKVEDGGEDIISDKAYENFELTLDWKISEAGNNGIFYTVQEDTVYNENWKTSPEMQVMDNQKHKDGLISKHRAGDLYDLIAANPVRVKDQGEWNSVRIVKDHGKIEHWLNGTMVLAYDVNSPEWKDMISKSKFKDLTEFATPGMGHIGFQDHDNEVFYKNIKIRLIK